MILAGCRYIYHPSHTDALRLWFLADIHWWNKDCVRNLFRSHVKAIADDPNALWIGMGDYNEYISPRDAKRADFTQFDESVLACELADGSIQADAVAEEMNPIKGKCLGLTLGNHEWSYQTHQEQSKLHNDMCGKLGVTNLGYSWAMNLVFVNKGLSGVVSNRPPKASHHCFTVPTVGHHGAGGASTVAGKMNTLKRLMSTFQARLYVMAHVHEQIAFVDPQLGFDRACKEIVDSGRLGIITGSYLKSYGDSSSPGYHERALGRASFLGAATVDVYPWRKRENLVAKVALTI